MENMSNISFLGACPVSGILLFTEDKYIGRFCNDGTSVLPLNHTINTFDRRVIIISYGLTDSHTEFSFSVATEELIFVNSYVNPKSNPFSGFQLSYSMQWFFTSTCKSEQTFQFEYTLSAHTHSIVYMSVLPILASTCVNNGKNINVMTNIVWRRQNNEETALSCGESFKFTSALKEYKLYFLVELGLDFHSVLVTITLKQYSKEHIFTNKGEDYICSKSVTGPGENGTISDLPGLCGVIHCHHNINDWIKIKVNGENYGHFFPYFEHDAGPGQLFILFFTFHGNSIKKGGNVIITHRMQNKWMMTETKYASNALELGLSLAKTALLELEVKHYEKLDIRFWIKPSHSSHCLQKLESHKFRAGYLFFNYSCPHVEFNNGFQITTCSVTSEVNFHYETALEIEPIFIGQYNPHTDRYQHILRQAKWQDIIFGPLESSVEEAVGLCENEMGSLTSISELNQWKRFPDLADYSTKINFPIYSAFGWLVLVKLEATENYDDQLHALTNCQAIQSAKNLVNKKYTSHLHGTGYVYDFVSTDFIRSVVELNEKLICTGHQEELPQEIFLSANILCALIIPNDYCLLTVLLFVPCHMQLHKVAFICSKIFSSESPTFTEAVKLTIVNERSLSKENTFFMNLPNDKYIRLLDTKNNRLFRTRGFLCGDGTFILQYRTCDGINHCPGVEDESNCSFMCLSNNQYLHADYCLHHCHKHNCSCSAFYFQCRSGGCIPASSVCNCNPDCQDQSDEAEELCSFYQCQWRGERNPTNRIAFGDCDISLRYKDTRHKVTFSLEQICDGKRDCDHGFDEWEDGCTNFTAVPSLRCGNGRGLVDLDAINNGVLDCRESFDDEIALFDEYLGNDKLEYCQVIALSVLCVNITNLPDLSNLTVQVILQNSVLNFSDLLPLIFDTSSNIIILTIEHCNISEIRPIYFTSEHLTTLTLTNSSVLYIKSESFRSQRLSYLDLSHNPFKKLGSQTFVLLKKLRYLNLSNTDLVAIASDQFQQNVLLATLDISYSKIVMVSSNVFSSTQGLHGIFFHEIQLSKENFIVDDDFFQFKSVEVMHAGVSRFCCLAPNRVNCFVDGYEECAPVCQERLLQKSHVLLYFGYIGIISFLNTASFVRSSTKSAKKKRPNSYFLDLNLNVADLLMAAFLLFIAFLDQIMCGKIAYLALRWHGSWWSRLAGMLHNLAVLMSSNATLLITVDRFMCIIVRPFQRYGFSWWTNAALVGCSWLMMTFAVLMQGFLLKSKQNSKCFIFCNLHVKVSFVFCVTVSGLMSIIMLLLNSAIVAKLIVNVKAKGKANSRVRPILRLLLIVVVNILPILLILIMIFLATNALSVVDIRVLESIALILFPVSPCLNPVLNTFTSLSFIQDVKARIRDN